jgi:hypothetical protein
MSVGRSDEFQDTDTVLWSGKGRREESERYGEQSNSRIQLPALRLPGFHENDFAHPDGVAGGVEDVIPTPASRRFALANSIPRTHQSPFGC